MKKILNWKVLMGAALVALSALLYYLHFGFFHDAHHIFIYLLGDVAFVPIEVLLVTLIIHQLLVFREKKALLKKLNMLIGAFFSNVGTRLLGIFTGFDPDIESFRAQLKVDKDWSEGHFRQVRLSLEKHTFDIDIQREDLQRLRGFLDDKIPFLLNLLANPNLLEHETFTELLWAVFHLAEELKNRDDLGSLPQSDLEHLAGDIKRAYSSLTIQWLSYMGHLKRDYPYLFSLALRTNPFDPVASPVVMGV